MRRLVATGLLAGGFLAATLPGVALAGDPDMGQLGNLGACLRTVEPGGDLLTGGPAGFSGPAVSTPNGETHAAGGDLTQGPDRWTQAGACGVAYALYLDGVPVHAEHFQLFP